jgi:cytochrome d ubiquinol oxidase subunit II
MRSWAARILAAACGICWRWAARHAAAEAIAEAIAPIWEANHVWLILVVVVLFTGFPAGFAAMMTALNIPITAMLIGIVLRGSAFIFRNYDSSRTPVQRHWSTVFGIASIFTPFSRA